METKDPGAIEARIELTAHDRERAMDYNFFVRRKWVLADIIFFVALSVVILAVDFSGLYDIPQILIYLAFGLLGLLVLFFLFVKMMAQTGGGNARYVKITEAALTTHAGGEKKEYTIKWSDFQHIGKTKHYYFLYPDVSQFLILPKRCFSEEERKALDRIIL